MPQDITTNAIRELLGAEFWIKDLSTNEFYSRPHDDNEGDDSQILTVAFYPNGDACIRTEHPKREMLRFRNFFGGGESPRVRKALMILAYAILLDNQESAPTISNE